MIYRKIILIALTTLLTLGLAGCGSSSYLETAETGESTGTEEADSTDTAEESSGDAAESQIVVQVAGAVNSPGVFSLSEDSRVADAIAAAGGLTENADISSLNLAEHLSDAQKITVYTADECEEIARNQAANESGSAAGVDAAGRININTASREQLMTISGIGETRADAIIAYREKNGPFTDISQIKNIDGIKDGVYAKIEDSITVG